MSKITELPQLDPTLIDGDEDLPIVKYGSTWRATMGDVYASVRASLQDLFNGVTVRGGGAAIAGAEPLAVFGANDADEIFRVFLAMMPDGTIRSEAIRAMIDDAQAGLSFAAQTVSGFQFVITQEAIDGRVYALAGLRNDGTWHPTSGAPAAPLVHTPFHGQSNAMADESKPPISTLASGWGLSLIHI